MINIKDHGFDYGMETKLFWKEGAKYKELDAALNVSIEKAYKDIMVRTLKRKESKETSCNLHELKDLIMGYIENGDFPEDCDNFDKFHNKLCQSALSYLKEEYENVEYGKAQKLVNMTFKYLYCTKYISGKKKQELFKECHIALDSIILEWLFKYVYPKYKIDNDDALTLKDASDKSNLTRESTPSWSNLTYSEDNKLKDDNTYTYNFFIQIIRKYFEDNKIDMQPFQAEFIIWREMQMELAAKEFLNSLKKYYKSDINPTDLIKDKSVTEQLTYIKNLIK